MARSEEELKAKFKEDPTSMEAFSGLRRMYKKAERWSDLAWLYQGRAEGLDVENRKADMFFKASKLYLEKLGEEEKGLECLYRGVILDPRHRRNSRKLIQILQERNENEKLLKIISNEIELLEEQGTNMRGLSELHLQAGELFVSTEENKQKALEHFKKSWEYDSRNQSALDKATQLLVEMKAFEQALPFLEAQIKTIREPSVRASKLQLIAQIQLEQNRDVEAAENSLREAHQLNPESVDILQSLAKVYSDRRYPTDKGELKTARVFLKIGRLHHQAQEIEQAITALKHSLNHDPYLEESFSLLASIYEQQEEWEILADHLKKGAEIYEGQTSIRLKFKYCRLLEARLNNLEEAKKGYFSLVEEAPQLVVPKLSEMFENEKDYEALAKLKEKQVKLCETPEESISHLLQLVELYENQLEKPGLAARKLHKILSIEPENLEALDRYTNHFRLKGDHRSQVDTMEIAVEAARKIPGNEELIESYLKEMVNIYHKHLGDLENTEKTLRVLCESFPRNSRYAQALDKVVKKREMWRGYKADLMADVEEAATEEQKLAAMLHFAEELKKRKLDVSLNIKLYQNILKMDPGNRDAYDGLEELFHREGDNESIYRMLEMKASNATVEQKEEIYYQMFDLAKEKLSDPNKVGKVAAKILELVPGDEEAMEALVDSLKAIENYPKLAQVLEKYAASVLDPAIKGEYLLKAANVYIEHLEQKNESARILKAVVDERVFLVEAMAKLVKIYEEAGNYNALADIVSTVLYEGEWPDSEEEMIEQWQNLGEIYEKRLHEEEKALQAYQRVHEIKPENTKIMVSIARLSYMLEQWDTLAAIMEQQLEASEEEQANNLAIKLADIYQNKLDKPLEAIRVLEDMESTDLQIMETIAQLYHDVGDLEHAVSLYEQLLEQSENDARRVNLSVKIAGIYQDDLHDDAKASELLEIALQLDPDNIDVIRHQVKLCYKEGKWNRFIDLNNKLMTMSDSQDEIYQRTLKNAEVYERELDKGAEAMEWYIRALKYEPQNEELLVSVERTAAEWGLWQDLFEVYQWLLQDCQDKYLEKSYYKRIVEIQEIKLENKEKAMDFLNRFLLKNPDDQDMLLEAERLADEFEGGYKVLVSIYEHLIHNCFDKQKKAELLVRTAKIFSEEMDDLESAFSRYERAFRANPFDSQILAKLESISRTLQKWDVYYSVQGVVLQKIDDPLEKVDEIFKLAKIIEEEAKDLVKAFRVYLHAFMLEPKNEEITNNLWRLAEKTGSYTPEQKEISPLEISPILKKGLALYHRGYEKYQEDLAKAPKKRRREVTQELEFDDLEIIEEEDELEEDDIFKVEYTAPTSGLSMQDLIEAKREETGNFSEVEMSDVIEEYESDIQASKDSLIVPIGSDSKTAQLPAPDSPWEEMVRAYAMLSHPDAITKVNHLRKIARIWQEGAENNEKAYKALVRAFSLIPEDTEIQELLENLAREMDIVKNCADTYFKIARESVKRETSLFLFKRASELYQEVENIEGMEESLRAILAVDQENELAYKRIKELLTKKEEWQELVSFLEWKLDLEIDSLSLDEKLEYFKKIAELYEEKLEDYEQALVWRSYYLDKEPDNVDALQASLRLSRSIKSWPKATEVLRKLVDLEDDEETQMQLLHELADITLQKLELPDQAINIYREILGISENDQVALDKLDQLYLEHELWTNLEEIIYRKIENEKEAEQENKLKHRYGEILKRLNRNSEAAAVYNDLWEETGNSRYAIKASEMYMEIDQPSQGVSILEGLLNSEQDDFTDREKASMWVQMAAIQRRSLNDQVKAQVSLQKAMELDPNNPDALLELANLAKKREDWDEYAQLQRKIGENIDEPSARDAALYVSATTYRNKLNELETAEEVLRQLIAKNNTHLDALNTLFELYTETEDWGRASRVLDHLIELAEDQGSHKAYLLAKQGDIYLKKFDDEDTAYQLLSDALEIDDNNVDAILTLSELAEKREELEHASDLLEDALKKLKDEPEKVAKLGRRYAQLMSKQEKAENAVTLLKELDRKYPDQLLIKLTLGEIRFKSGRWRETTKLLVDIGDHPDAPEYSREVARALCMAAESEIKQRRRGATPNKLWERAVQLQPDYLPAIEALIEYHLENGDKHEAAEYLKAQAQAADKPESRITLFKSLGELYIEQLDNKKEAFYCFLNAYNELEKMERNDEDLNLLKKLVELSGHLDKDNEIINAVHLLYEKGEYESELDLLLRLGKVYLDKQDTDNAVEYLEKAQKKAPANESVLDNLSQLYHIIGRYEDAAHLIEMLLERKSSGEMKNLDYRLKLMNRLGDIYCQMEEGKEKAVDCIEESLQLNSKQPEQRKKLISLYGDNDKYTEEKIRQQEIYLQSNPLQIEYIENLADWYESQNNQEKSFLYFQFLNLFDQLSPERVEWLRDRMQDIEQVEVKYSGTLSDEDRKLLAAGAISESMEEVFNVLWEAAPVLFKKNLSSLGLSKDDKVSPVDKSNLAVVFSEMSKVTGSRSTRLYLADSDIVQGVRVAPHAPPLIMLDHDTADNLPGTLRFLISRALQLAKPKFILAAGYFPEEFSVFFSALIRAFHPKYKKRQFKSVDPIDVQAKQLKEQLPYRISKNIVEIFKNQETSSFNSGRWRRNAWMVGNRIGLLTTGDLYETVRIVVYEEVEKVLALPLDLDVIMELANKNESIKDIFQFYFSEVHLQMRKKIGMTLQD